MILTQYPPEPKIEGCSILSINTVERRQHPPGLDMARQTTFSQPKEHCSQTLFSLLIHTPTTTIKLYAQSWQVHRKLQLNLSLIIEQTVPTNSSTTLIQAPHHDKRHHPVRRRGPWPALHPRGIQCKSRSQTHAAAPRENEGT